VTALATLGTKSERRSDMRICRLRKARRHPRSRRMWAPLILSPFNGFSSRNRREVPRRAPHRRHSAHRRPPIAPTLPPPGRQVARGAGAAGSLQPSLQILPNDFAVPSNCTPQSIAGTLSSSSYPGHLQSTSSYSFRTKDRSTVCVTKLVPPHRPFGKPTSQSDRSRFW